MNINIGDILHPSGEIVRYRCKNWDCSEPFNKSDVLTNHWHENNQPKVSNIELYNGEICAEFETSYTTWVVPISELERINVKILNRELYHIFN